MASSWLSSKVTVTSSSLYAGFLISFLGSLPPGTTNIILVEIAGADGLYAAAMFALGGVLAELICVKLCLMIMRRAMHLSIVAKSIQWLSLIFLALLAIAYFILSFHDAAADDVSTLFSRPGSPFPAGFFMMLINPVQLPFWLGWTTIVVGRKSVNFHSHDELFYLSGIALGSLLASALFIFVGHLIASFLASHRTPIRFMLAFTFTMMTLLQARRMWRGRVKIGT